MFEMSEEIEKFLEDAEDDSKNLKLLIDFKRTKLSYKAQEGFEVKPKYKKAKKIVQFKKSNNDKNLF
tara:strand:- start:814 stop:1014 length:201 start_codon:yes stop_codon:yes gene_type:complete